VRFRGRFPDEDKNRLLSRFDALLIPSIGWESFGLVAREAMAAGTPVISARGSALVEMFEEGTCGAFFTPGDAGALRQVIQQLVDRPETLTRWAHHLPLIKSVEEHCEDIEEIYATLEVAAVERRAR
jgi:glycosyltransferase involved in cell wall biosynthesis